MPDLLDQSVVNAMPNFSFSPSALIHHSQYSTGGPPIFAIIHIYTLLAVVNMTKLNKNINKIYRYALVILFLSVILFIARLDNNRILSTSEITTKATETTPIAIEQQHEAYCKWYSPFPETIIPSSERKPDDQIRYAAFGTSHTWGATLSDRHTQTYVKKLSSNENPDHSTNFGIRSSGPNYPAACTHSMMGDEEYDVIIMEYNQGVDSSLMDLAKRLRERFPDAILLIARFWNPTMLENRYHENLRQIAHRDRLFSFNGGFIHDDKFKNKFMEKKDSNDWRWTFQTIYKEFLEVQESVARETGSYIVEMAGWGAEDAYGENGYLEIGDKMLGSDSFHLSEAGHEDFANRVKVLVHRVGVPKKPAIRQFTSIDFCLNWFHDGFIGKGLKYSDNAVIRQMPNTEKYVMEFDGDEPGWIEMTNPSDENMYMFAAYMTTGPSPSKYPKTEAYRKDNGAITNRKIISPLAFVERNPKANVHISALSKLGLVRPHQTARVYFKSLEETEWPFRIVQAILTQRATFGSKGFTMPDSSRLNGISDPA